MNQSKSSIPAKQIDPPQAIMKRDWLTAWTMLAVGPYVVTLLLNVIFIPITIGTHQLFPKIDIVQFDQMLVWIENILTALIVITLAVYYGKKIQTKRAFFPYQLGINIVFSVFTIFLIILKFSGVSLSMAG